MATDDAQQSRRGFSVWVGGIPAVLLLKRLLVMLGAVLPMTALCTLLDHGLLWPLLLWFGTWPFPWRCELRPGNLSIRWWFVEHLVPLSQDLAVRLCPDPRRWVLFGKRRVLALQRPGGRQLLLFAPEPLLVAIAREINEAQKLPGPADAD